MQAIYAELPGRYKKVKAYEKNRVCRCGTLLSIYNKGQMCYHCEKL